MPTAAICSRDNARLNAGYPLHSVRAPSLTSRISQGHPLGQPEAPFGRGVDPSRIEGSVGRMQRCRASAFIDESLYCSWSKEHLGARKKRLAPGTTRAATRIEVKDPLREVVDIKVGMADFTLKTAFSKKHGCGWQRRGMRHPPSIGLGEPPALQNLQAVHIPVLSEFITMS